MVHCTGFQRDWCKLKNGAVRCVASPTDTLNGVGGFSGAIVLPQQLKMSAFIHHPKSLGLPNAPTPHFELQLLIVNRGPSCVVHHHTFAPQASESLHFSNLGWKFFNEIISCLQNLHVVAGADAFVGRGFGGGGAENGRMDGGHVNKLFVWSFQHSLSAKIHTAKERQLFEMRDGQIQ